MHDIQIIRDNPSKFDDLLKRRGVNPQSEVILRLDKNERLLKTQIQDLQYERKIISEKIGKLKSSNSHTNEIEGLLEQVHQIKSKISDFQEKIDIIDKELSNLMMTLPNLPAEDVPIGENEEQNVELKERKFKSPALKKTPQHFEIKSIE